MKDPYQVLGVQARASAEEIKVAYRKLSMEHHPDAGGGHDAFTELNDAYSVLSDPIKRANFDKRERFRVSLEAEGVDEITVWEIVSKVLAQMIEILPIDHESFILASIDENLSREDHNLKEMERILAITKEYAAQRFDLSNAYDLLTITYKARLADLEDGIRQAEKRLKTYECVSEILADYLNPKPYSPFPALAVGSTS
jgi:curved DNA-binding protein CbpA